MLPAMSGAPEVLRSRGQQAEAAWGWAAAEVAAPEALPGGAAGLPESHRPTTITRQPFMTCVAVCALCGIIHIFPETDKPEMTKRWRMNPLFQKPMSRHVPHHFVNFPFPPACS